MSFLKSLFGGKSGAGSEAPGSAAAATAEHKGFSIAATPYKEGGQWQLCGVISKDVDGTRKEQRFVRADRFESKDEAAARTLDKGRQLIDEQGEGLFR